MALFKKNVDLGSPLVLSPWRKVALGTWRDCGDPSVYALIQYDVSAVLPYLEKLKNQEATQTSGNPARITLSHFVGKAIAETIRRHPEINCVLRLGRLYPRKSIDVFYQVATDMHGEDLSGTTIRNADQKSIRQVAREMEEKVQLIKSKQDQSYTKMKGLFGLVPGILSSLLIDLSSWLMYTLNVWSPLLGAPRDSFGSVMVTNVGSLGIDNAFAPLVPYSRVPLLLAVGTVKDGVVAENGQPVVRPLLTVSATFDHRLIDGVHAAKMSKTLQRIFREPERELGLD
jgi:pyruvate/2-oxoglutarate dehydrogenase complex dihydrolipoamide acyltransferase (E2) component